jgi:DNA processing protein
VEEKEAVSPAQLQKKSLISGLAYNMESEKMYWLGFSAFPGIGPLRFKLLLSYFGSAKKAWEAAEQELIKIGLGEKLTAQFIAFKRKISLSGYAKEVQSKNIKVVTLIDKEYPKLLAEIPAAPFVIYVRGNLNWDIAKSIGVVGTRMVTGYGQEVTRKLTAGLVDAGLTIVSGMAYGVDTVAHETAIENGGKTIAVLGCGVDVIYPASNTKLYWKIVEEYGTVISEFPPGMMTTKGLFPSRNRIISGLSLGVVVTEGAKDSGALITARYAAEQGREVFAVPGPITSPLSKGPTMLLKQGAKLVTEVDDILEELKISKSQNFRSGKSDIGRLDILEHLTAEEKKAVEILQNEDLHFDEIVRKSSIEAAKLGGILTVLEMKKIIKNMGGGIYGLYR